MRFGDQLCHVVVSDSASEPVTIDRAQHLYAKQDTAVGMFPVRPIYPRSSFSLQSSQHYRGIEIHVHRRRLSARRSATRSTFSLTPLRFFSDETGLRAGMIFSSAGFCSIGPRRAIGWRWEVTMISFPFFTAAR